MKKIRLTNQKQIDKRCFSFNIIQVLALNLSDKGFGETKKGIVNTTAPMCEISIKS